MWKFLRYIKETGIIGRFRVRISKFIVGLVPKDRDLILFTAWLGRKYADNCMYVFEYILKNTNYNAYWVTVDPNIYRRLNLEGKPVLMANTLKTKWKLMRAVAVFSSIQFYDYNQFYLSKTIYIDLGHGHPVKDPGSNSTNPYALKMQSIYLKHLRYYAIVASSFARSNYKNLAAIPDDHIFISDFARNDAFIYPELRKGKNEMVDYIKSDKKAVVYMPTHRSTGNVHLNMHELLPLRDIDDFCDKNGWVFIIKKHFYHQNEHEDFKEYRHIYDITENNDIDPQTLLYQADILISDYSACYIDYLLLNRPLMFYHFDTDEFQKKERHLHFDFNKLDICPIAHNKEEFMDNLRNLSLSPVDKYAKRRNAFLPTYFANPHQENGRGKVVAIMEQLINNYYN